MAFGYEGKLVRLAPLDVEAHLENAYRWLNDPEITRHLLVGHFPMSRLIEKDYLEMRSREVGSEIAFAIETLEGKHIGFSGIHKVDYRHGIAETGTIIGDKSLWGTGCGTDAAIVRARYCFETLGLRLLTSGYFEGNERSAKMQARVGYEIIGTVPKMHWKCGDFRDHTLTYLRRERFFELHGRGQQ